VETAQPMKRTAAAGEGSLATVPGYNRGMDTPESPRRPWLTHERAVLVVIALLAMLPLGWLGWQAAIVQYRRAMRERIQASGGTINTPGPLAIIQSDADIPKIRRLLGDEFYHAIIFDRPLTAADREAIAAFPEAQVGVKPPR
jgi:hypothetical protein